MKKPVDLIQVPPGGEWSYVEPETGMKIAHNHWRSFLEKAFKHREANGLYTGGGWQDIVWDLLCRQNPQVPSIDTEKPERRMDFADVRRFAITLSNWLGAEEKWVAQEEAERRAAICAGCPYNVVVSGCWGCKGPLNWIVEMMGNRQTSRDADLQQCSKCFCTLRAKVHIPLDVMLEGQEPLEDLPDFCWLKG